MEEAYIGVLSEDEPIYDYLAHHVLGTVTGRPVKHAVFDMYRLHPKMLMVRYAERNSDQDLACKFYGRKLPTEGERPDEDYFYQMLMAEYERLKRVRDLGFDRPPYRVVEPLAVNPELEFLLVEEYVTGPKLDTYMTAAATEGKGDDLRRCLRNLAQFFGELHRRSATPDVVPVSASIGYLEKIMRQLQDHEVITSDQFARLEELRDRWVTHPALGNVPRVLLHGDATPINFIFCNTDEVVVIDLERSHMGDGMSDVGSIESEVRHAFRLAGNVAAADAYVDEFAATYQRARASQGTDAALSKSRSSFWRGVFDLRMSRNDWLTLDYRHELVKEGIAWLSQ